MWRFRKRATALPAEPVIRDPLAVIPLVPPNVEAKPDARGLLHLRQNVATRGMRKRFARWFRFDYSRNFDLDEYGTLYFTLVDGKRTVREIIDEMMARTGRARPDVEMSVIRFTKALMLQEMIVLKVTPESRVGRPS